MLAAGRVQDSRFTPERLGQSLALDLARKVAWLAARVEDLGRAVHAVCADRLQALAQGV